MNDLPKTARAWKCVFKLSQTLGKSLFPGWKQLSYSLKSRPRDDRYIEYLEIQGFHQNPWLSRICTQIYSTTKAGDLAVVTLLKKQRLTWNFRACVVQHALARCCSQLSSQLLTSQSTFSNFDFSKFWNFEFSGFRWCISAIWCDIWPILDASWPIWTMY